MALFWCPFGRASRIEYVYSHRAPAFVAFTAIIIMLFLPPHKPIRMLVCAEYAFGDCCVWQNDVHYWYGCSNE